MPALPLAALAFCFATAATTAFAATLAAWVQLGSGGEVSARAIVDTAACPTLRIDGAQVAMQPRAAPDTTLDKVPKAAFPVLSCEAAVAPSAKALSLDGRDLPLPPIRLRRVAVIGDTGCRLKGAFAVQDCNDADAWPYAKIVAHVVAAQPDLVIHVGDYHYRETPCPPERQGCRGSPFGFGWDAWNADFFRPSAPLFAAAPLLLARGNHEDCIRAAEGWFRFLAHAPMQSECTDLTGFFVSRVGSVGFVVMDGAAAADDISNRSQTIGKLRQQFAAVRDDIPAEAWLITHRPLNAVRSLPEQVENAIQQSAIGDQLPDSVRMIVSGHNHFFQALDFGDPRPAQLVVGASGDMLVPIPGTSLVGREVNGARIVEAASRAGFAYMVWDRTESGWDGTLFDDNGRAVEECRLVGRRLRCVPLAQ